MPPSPDFNTWTVVFLLVALQGFMVALLLLRWRRGHRPANRLLAALVLLFSLTMLEYVFFWTRSMWKFPHLANLSAHFPLLFGPLLWWYCRTIYGGPSFSRRDLWHLAPFALAVAVFWPWYSLSAEEKFALITGQGTFPVRPAIIRVLIWGRILHLAAYAVWIGIFLSRQLRTGETARWARRLNAFFIGFILAYASYYVLARMPFFSLLWDYHISAAMSVFIYLIVYAGLVQPGVFDGLQWTEAAAPAKYRNSSLTPEASRSLLRHLEDLMDREKRYREPELRLEDLARLLQVSKHHLSQAINEHYDINFFEYLNRRRLEEARQLLAATPKRQLNVSEIAYAVGFNNKVSFNHAFKKMTGQTPTEFRRQAQRERNLAPPETGRERPDAAGGLSRPA
jgi:AraC-like DNA-binding protein